MLDDLTTYLTKLEDGVHLTDRELHKLGIMIETTQIEISMAKNRITSMQSEDPSFYKFEALSEVRESAPNLYRRVVKDAAINSSEYAYDQFLAPLLDISTDENLFKLETTGVGWSSGMTAHLAMDEVAGTLSDYAEAVESARGALGVKDGRDRVKASAVWKEKIYKHSRYYTTINLRMEAAAGKAPFWSLLNNGNKSVSMTSNIGGTAWPDVEPTHFVEEIENSLTQQFEFLMKFYRGQHNDRVGELETQIEEAKKAIMVAEDLIELSQVDEEHLEDFAKKLGTEEEKLSRVKIHRTVERLGEGKYVPAQVTVSAPGEKRRRVTREKFIRLTTTLGE